MNDLMPTGQISGFTSKTVNVGGVQDVEGGVIADCGPFYPKNARKKSCGRSWPWRPRRQ